MKKVNFLPYFIAIIIFYVLSYSYFSPLLERKELRGSDNLAWRYQNKAISDFQKEYKETPKWSDNVFSGMPGLFISISNPGDLVAPIKNILQKLFGVFPAVPLMIMLIGFFFLLRVLKVDPWLSIVGSIGYGFTTFFFTLIPAGHNTQVYAFAYIAPLIASVIIAYKYNRWLGASLVGVFASFELSSSHPQMAYYAVILLAIFAVVFFVKAILENTWKKFIITSFVIFVFGLIALGSSMNVLYPQYEFQKHSIRNTSELSGTNVSNGIEKSEISKSSGLDYDYATSWSYGIDETFNILIPNLKGGGGSDYWGDQPFTTGPMYIGAVLIFLFVLAMFLLKGAMKWWLLISTILSILLCWGYNSIIFDFFFYNVPFFNKFRNPSWALVIAMISIPLGATLGLQKIIAKEYLEDKIKKQILISVFIVGGICLLFWIAPGIAGNFEKQYLGQSGQIIPESVVKAQEYARQSGKPLNQQLLAVFDKMQIDIIQKRKADLKSDALRSFFLIFAAFVGVYLFVVKKKLKSAYFILFMGIIVLVDLWGINIRFLDKDQFSRKLSKRKEIITPFKADRFILQAEKDKHNFRVLDLTQVLSQDSRTSYFHRSLGGYNAAKLRRYQELVDYQLDKETRILRANLRNYKEILFKSPVINMLNTKYIIYNHDSSPIINPHSYGVGWLVYEIIWAENANKEIEALSNFNPLETAIINNRFKKEISIRQNGSEVGNGNISIASYKMDNIIYDITTDRTSLAIFSEIYYPNWHAFIDGEEVPVFQCNYVLRGVEVPEGKHKVEFKYIAPEYMIGSVISYISSFIIVGLFMITLGFYIYNKKLVFKLKRKSN